MSELTILIIIVVICYTLFNIVELFTSKSKEIKSLTDEIDSLNDDLIYEIDKKECDLIKLKIENRKKILESYLKNIKC